MWTCFQGCTVSRWWSSSLVTIQLFFLWGLFRWGQDRGREEIGRELLSSANSVQESGVVPSSWLLGQWGWARSQGGEEPCSSRSLPLHTFTRGSAVWHVHSQFSLKGEACVYPVRRSVSGPVTADSLIPTKSFLRQIRKGQPSAADG